MPVTYDDLGRPPLHQGDLSRALAGAESLWRSVEVLPTAASTNALVAQRARAGEAEGLVIVADHQTRGRGRLDRTWTTPPGAALTFSFLLTPREVSASRWSWLPLITGIAVAEAVTRRCDIPCDLKWPNDVMVSGAKVAGVLVERLDVNGGPVAVVGVGLNVATSREELPVASATSLQLEGARTTDRTVLLREILRFFAALYDRWRASGGIEDSELSASYSARCATVGQVVRVSLPTGAQVRGTATGVDGDGCLVVSTPTGPVTVSAGDVVHVRRDNEGGAEAP